ncbi:hypothetical protein N657DRAFT_85525 [Parathielavia appendiculata]|uniref:Uncharacterized protein n=1 Tax=Parathielavia appendiculata TaxID=2587402 RepID=A0AAN6Z972_9PEZI|nr:hypothetical protein N657DRAFT_85525 [Parathielavia appendiculata]
MPGYFCYHNSSGCYNRAFASSPDLHVLHVSGQSSEDEVEEGIARTCHTTIRDANDANAGEFLISVPRVGTCQAGSTSSQCSSTWKELHQVILGLVPTLTAATCTCLASSVLTAARFAPLWSTSTYQLFPHRDPASRVHPEARRQPQGSCALGYELGRALLSLLGSTNANNICGPC